MLLPWYKQPNAWLVMFISSCLTAIVVVELCRVAVVAAQPEPADQAPQLDAETSHTAYRPYGAAADVESIIGTAQEDVLLNDTEYEATAVVEQVRALRELYIKKIREHDARERGSKDASETVLGESG